MVTHISVDRLIQANKYGVCSDVSKRDYPGLRVLDSGDHPVRNSASYSQGGLSRGFSPGYGHSSATLFHRVYFAC